jgi:hypothetical protein
VAPEKVDVVVSSAAKLADFVELYRWPTDRIKRDSVRREGM